jgi:hypothetical protein
MNINYHYYTIKTLARHAGFNEEAAQIVAHFSQRVDDFVLSSPIIVSGKPSDFFVENKLALELSSNNWLFLPCPTAASVVRGVSHNYQLRTLMPFHFIMDVPWSKCPVNADRSFLRCTAAKKGKDLLINRLVKGIVDKTKLDDEASLMALGVILHTFADTYAHDGFSGFHGWENESYIAKMTHRCRDTGGSIPERFMRFIRTRYWGITDRHEGLSPFEISSFRRLPSIGHANVFSAPDYCDCEVEFFGKKDEEGSLVSVIKRDNTTHFAECSRQIVDMFCKISGKTLYDDEEWGKLQNKLSDAQNVRRQSDKKTNKKKWGNTFREDGIRYGYSKNEFLSAELKILHTDKRFINRLPIGKNALRNINSEEGDEARFGCIMFAESVSPLFFDYNELAYKHVFSTTGRYASLGRLDLLENQRTLIEKTINLKEKLGG